METGDYKHIQAILVNTFSSWEELNTSFKVGTWLKGDASEGASGAVSGGGLSAALPVPWHCHLFDLGPHQSGLPRCMLSCCPHTYSSCAYRTIWWPLWQMNTIMALT